MKQRKPIPMKRGNTSGVRNHYRAYHVKEYMIIFKESSNQQRIDELFVMEESVNNVTPEVNMARELVCWTSYKNLPVNFFDDEITQNFFKLLNGDLDYPRRNVFADQLLSHFQEMKVNLKSILDQITSKMAFTVDGWWARNKASSYAITIHFINDQWELISSLLDMLPAEGKHAGKDIAEIFNHALEFFGITKKLIGKKITVTVYLDLFMVLKCFF